MPPIPPGKKGQAAGPATTLISTNNFPIIHDPVSMSTPLKSPFNLYKVLPDMAGMMRELSDKRGGIPAMSGKKTAMSGKKTAMSGKKTAMSGNTFVSVNLA